MTKFARFLIQISRKRLVYGRVLNKVCLSKLSSNRRIMVRIEVVFPDAVCSAQWRETKCHKLNNLNQSLFGKAFLKSSCQANNSASFFSDQFFHIDWFRGELALLAGKQQKYRTCRTLSLSFWQCQTYARTDIKSFGV